MPNSSSASDPLNFAQNLWGKMGFSLPGMVTPTFDVDELEKRLTDLKTVEGWLKMNLSMLQMTIKALEMQCSTLHAVRALGNLKPDLSASAPPPGADSQASEALQSVMWPWALMQQMQAQMQKAMEQPEVPTDPVATTTPPTKKSP